MTRSERLEEIREWAGSKGDWPSWVGDDAKWLLSEVERLEKEKNGAYSERNQCVALIARMATTLGWKAGVREHPAEDKAWEDDWRTVVFVDTPEGQASWHFHDSEKHLLGGLFRYVGKWDGHDTAEKYRRVGAALKRRANP